MEDGLKSTYRGGSEGSEGMTALVLRKDHELDKKGKQKVVGVPGPYLDFNQSCAIPGRVMGPTVNILKFEVESD